MSPSKQYIPGLDGVRALAICPVIVIHLGSYFSKELERAISGGFLGVDLFFVLSGFLITSILLREITTRGNIRYAKFYMRRALRLLPVIFAALIAHLLYAHLSQLPWDLEKRSLLSILFYYANFEMAYSYGVQFAEGMGHMWSLSVEEQFYLLWPVLLVFMAPLVRRPNALAGVIFGAIILVLLWRGWLWSQRPGEWYWLRLYVSTDTRADSLLVGALFAVIGVPGAMTKRWLPLLGNIGLLTLLLCMFTLTPSDTFLYYGGMTLLACASGLVIYSVVHLDRWWAVLFENPVARGIGRVSYGLYVWHMPIFAGTARYTDSFAPVLQIAIGLTLLIVVTLFSWFFIEKPFLRMKHRFH